nr:hypothetical protein [Kitasatospora fiedleri]
MVIGAPLLTAVAAKLPRKTVLIGLAGLFTFGNLLCALAPNFAFLAAARLITGLPHGAFFGPARWPPPNWSPRTCGPGRCR